MSVLGKTVEFDGLEGMIMRDRADYYIVRTEIGKLDQNVLVANDVVEDQLEGDA